MIVTTAFKHIKREGIYINRRWNSTMYPIIIEERALKAMKDMKRRDITSNEALSEYLA